MSFLSWEEMEELTQSGMFPMENSSQKLQSDTTNTAVVFSSSLIQESSLFGKQIGNTADVDIKGNLLSYGGRCGSIIDAIQFFYWSETFSICYLYFNEEYVIIFPLILYILTFIGRDSLLTNERINMIVLFMNL